MGKRRGSNIVGALAPSCARVSLTTVAVYAIHIFLTECEVWAGAAEFEASAILVAAPLIANVPMSCQTDVTSEVCRQDFIRMNAFCQWIVTKGPALEVTIVCE